MLEQERMTEGVLVDAWYTGFAENDSSDWEKGSHTDFYQGRKEQSNGRAPKKAIGLCTGD